jgi:hypothetical protein
VVGAAHAQAKCTVDEALRRATTLSEDEVGRGWREPRQAPWQLGHVMAALSACRFSKGPRWDELERRAASFRHPVLSNTQLMQQGRDALLNDTLGFGAVCQCALAIQHFGPRGIDLNGVLAPR